MIAITKLTQLLHKDGLLFWANKIGLEGIQLSDYRKKSTNDGTDMHTKIQNYLLYKIPFEFSEKLDNCLFGYDIIAVEKSFDNGFISCRTDLLISKDGVNTVVDFKSNKNVYLEQKLQLSTYKEILNYDKIATINFDKWELNFIEINTNKYFNVIRFLYKIHSELKLLNEKI
jgi:hypothetical protein